MKKQIVVIHGGDTFDTYEGYLEFLKSFQINFEDFLSINHLKFELSA